MFNRDLYGFVVKKDGNRNDFFYTWHFFFTPFFFRFSLDVSSSQASNSDRETQPFQKLLHDLVEIVQKKGFSFTFRKRRAIQKLHAWSALMKALSAAAWSADSNSSKRPGWRRRFQVSPHLVCKALSLKKKRRTGKAKHLPS